MSAGDSGNERLRRTFGGTTGSTPPQGSCLADEEIWLAARGELDDEAKRRFLDHLLECDACAESCRMASELVDEESGPRTADIADSTPRPDRAPRPVWSWTWVALPAAAMLILAIVWIGPFGRRDETPGEEFREIGETTIGSLLDESILLAREECELRWEEGPEGTLYSVAVSTEDLTVLDRAEELDRPDYTVPPSALEGLSPGATFLWRVEALFPDGTRATSPVFRATIE